MLCVCVYIYIYICMYEERSIHYMFIIRIYVYMGGTADSLNFG